MLTECCTYGIDKLTVIYCSHDNKSAAHLWPDLAVNTRHNCMGLLSIG